MIFFGHLVASVFAAQGLNGYWRMRRAKSPEIPCPPLDLRAVAVLSILPDLIDKPLAVLWPAEFGYHTRVFGHSLLVAGLVLAGLRVFRLKRHFLLWAVYLGHLVADRVWEHDLEYLFWPLLGDPAPRPPVSVKFVGLDTFHPAALTFELFAFYVALALAIYYRLYRKETLLAFLRTGTLQRASQ